MISAAYDPAAQLTQLDAPEDAENWPRWHIPHDDDPADAE